MMFIKALLLAVISGLTGAFLIPVSTTRSTTNTQQLFATVVSDSSTIGTVGNGYISVLLAKLSALAHEKGKSWIVTPAADVEMMKQLVILDEFGKLPENLEFVAASDTDRVEELLRETDALMVAIDDVDSVVDPSVINYLLDPQKVNNLKRVVAMSRNLNGAGMGMLVTASKRAANAQVWDNSNANAYRSFETNLKDAAKNCGADWTIVRAGTLLFSCFMQKTTQLFTKLRFLTSGMFPHD